jgi:hypothetical protein
MTCLVSLSSFPLLRQRERAEKTFIFPEAEERERRGEISGDF